MALLDIWKQMDIRDITISLVSSDAPVGLTRGATS